MVEAKIGLLEELFDAIVTGNIRLAKNIAERAVEKGLSADLALEKMMEAIQEVDKKYEMKEYFTVDVASAATAMREAFRIFEPHLKVKPANVVGKVVIGSLKGNIQGLGKDIVTAALRSAGFHVVDLGVDVTPEAFVDTVIREEAQVIAISVSVEETVPLLKEIVELLHRKKIKEKIKTVIGGRAVSERTTRKYGIDAYAKDAWDCVRKVRTLLS